MVEVEVGQREQMAHDMKRNLNAWVPSEKDKTRALRVDPQKEEKNKDFSWGKDGWKEGRKKARRQVSLRVVTRPLNLSTVDSAALLSASLSFVLFF